MTNSIKNFVFSTDIFPVIGGATGALTQVRNIMFPSLETIIYTIILAAIGATVGYLVKLLLDRFLKKKK